MKQIFTDPVALNYKLGITNRHSNFKFRISMLKADSLGKKGEDIAKEYLIKKGYQILACNWFDEHREIDIIAREGEEVVIVEVKSRESFLYEEPWEAVTNRKIRYLVEAAETWLLQEQIDLETRFDVISIVFSKDGSYELTHFENAFTPPVN